MSTIRDILDLKGVNVLTINSNAPVLEAIGTMSEANVGAIVIQDGNQPSGIFTERDYLSKIALEGRSSSDTPVSQASVLASVAARCCTMTARRCSS